MTYAGDHWTWRGVAGKLLLRLYRGVPVLWEEYYRDRLLQAHCLRETNGHQFLYIVLRSERYEARIQLVAT